MLDGPLVIVNPTAGGGRAGRLVPWLRERLERRPEADLRVTRRAGEAETLAANAVASGRDRVVAVGGDGTVQETANGVLDAGGAATVGIVPVGTGNDLARSLGLPRDPAAAWRAAVGRTTTAIDAGRATNGTSSRWFLSAGGVGFDARVAAAMARQRGWRAARAGYLLTTIAELRRFENCVLRIGIDGEHEERRVLFVAFANGPYYGGGMRIAPDARTDDGRLDICIVGDISRLTAVRQLPNLYRGTHLRHPAVKLRHARSLTVESDAASPIHLDGEPFGMLPLRVDVVARRLSVAVEERAGPPGTPASPSHDYSA